jgi:hypothetical protein
MKKIFLISFLIIRSFYSPANTFITVKDGCWCDPTVWNQNAIPAPADTVEILNTVYYTYDLTFQSPSYLYIASNGTLCGNSQINLDHITADFYGNLSFHTMIMSCSYITNFGYIYYTFQMVLSCGGWLHNTGGGGINYNGPVPCNGLTSGIEVEEINQYSFTINPNPLRGNNLNISINKPGTYLFALYNSSGSKVYSTTVFLNNIMSLSLTEKIPNGIYFYWLTNDSHEINIRGKLVIEK